MKKVKTIVTSLLIFFAAAFMSACSCGGQDPVDQVYETGITIKCLSENITNTLDEESGLLTISCHRGDEFVIEYTLTPSNATTTQVDWEFDKDGIVDSRTYTRSQSTIESITFNARSKGEVTLTFTTKATGKKAFAKITVYDAKVALPTFASPENISYNPDKAELSWDQVNKVITSQGVLQDATLTGTSILGLTGYEVSLTDLSDNTTTTTLVTTNKLGGLERGKSYSVVVKAIGDGFNVKTGEASVVFKYHQIATATELANNKGNISFVSPNYASVNRVYYIEGDKSKFISPSTTSGATSNVNYKQFSGYENLDEFVVSVQSFPDSYKYNEALGYAVGDDGIRYYPSVVTESITIQKLNAPTLTLVNNKQDITIDGVVFTNENPDEKPNVSSMISWNLGGKVYSSNYGVKFAYQLIKDGQSSEVIVTNDTYFDLKGLKAGEYTLNAYTVGNDSNTIPSSTVTISLTVLDTIKNIYVSGGTTAEWNIVDNVLNINPEYKIDGVELYFVNKNNSANSQKFYFPAYDNITGYNVPTINISKLGLAAGTYDVYGRYVGVISDNGATMSATSDVNNSEDRITITVVDPVTSTKIESSGLITFANVSTATSYDFIVRQTRTSNPVTITVYTSNSSGVPANSIYASDVVNGERTISFYDIVRKIVATVQGITEEQIETLVNGYVHSDFTMSYQIIAKGNGSETIDASATRQVNFGRLKDISNIKYFHSIDGGNINENTNILAFSPVANATRYVIGIERYATSSSETRITDVVSQPIVGYTNSQSGLVEIDITNVQIAGSEDTFGAYITRLVSEYNAVSISFSIKAIGSNGNTTTQGNLDTVISVVPYGVTSTPDNLKVNENGILSWSATNTQNEQYLVKFYLVNGETHTEIDSYRFILNSAMTIEEDGEDIATGDGVEDGDDNEPEPEPEPVNPFSVDISRVLGDYEGQTIAVTIEELNASRINGNASSKYFAIQLPRVVANYSTNGTTPVISWDAVDGADYYDIEVTSLLLLEPIKVANITSNYYAIPDDWDFDVYNISVVAKKTNSGSNSSTNPYVLYSTPTIKFVTIASAIIEARAEGTNVVWGDIGLGTEYKFEYKLVSASTYTEVDPSTIVRDIIDTTKLMFDASGLEDGVYSFKVTPSVDFTDKNGMAYIIRGTVQDNTITRLQPADTLATENGNITFQVYADPTIETLLPELYIEGEGGNYNKISSDEYILTHESINLGGENTCLKYTLVLNNSASGNLKFKVKVVASGYLDSVLSGELSANKLSAIEDFTKEGEWISWSNQADISEYLILYGLNAETMSELRIYIEGNATAGYKGIVDVIVEGSTIRQELTSDKFKYVDGKFYYLFDEEEFIKYGAGAYSFTIKPITNKAGAISGSVSAPTTITKLNNEAVIGIENGEITISPYVQLEGVTETPTFVSITVKGYTITNEQVATGTGEGGEPPYEEREVKVYTGSYSSDVQFVADETIRLNLSDIALYDAGTYEVTVKYIGNRNLVLDSTEVLKDGLEKLQTTTLGTVEGEITWGAIETADKYAIKVVQSDGTEEIIEDVTLTEGVAILPKNAYTFELGKTYTLYIQAQGANYINSEWSEGFNVRKLQAPTNLQLQAERNVVTGENGETTYVGEPFIKWSDPNGTKHKLNYVLTFNNEDVEDIIIYSPTTPEAILTYQVLDKTLPIGIYLLQLRVLGNTTTGTNNTGLLSSDFGTGINANYIQDVKDVKVENGVIRWSEISGAYAYKISAYIKSEYDSDPISAEAQFSTFVTETNYNQNTGNYEYTFTDTNIADLNSYFGNYTIVVNAYTDPTKAIVSTNAEIEQANTTNLYKPQVVDNYKVKDGMLSWTISIANIREFVEAQVDSEGNTLLKIETTSTPEDGSTTVVQLDPTLVVLQYIVDKINLGKDDNTSDEKQLAEQLSFIYKIQLKVNGAVVTDIADSVAVYNGSTIVNDKSKYADATTLEFTYNVSIDPEDMIIEDYIPEIPEETPDESGEENEEETPIDPNLPDVENTLSATPASANNLASWYTIQIASVGNSDTSVPVINSGYTKELKAYKPMTPRSWIKEGNDIVEGNVLWELVTTEKATTEIADYYKDYRVTAVSNELGKAYYDVTIDEANIKDDYKYYEHLKDMFVTEGGDTNFVHYNNFYTIMINTLGTKDSDLLGADETIYLNSNPFKFTNPANILSYASAIKVENSELSWGASYGSLATKLFIYGPFDNLQADGVTYNDNWRDGVDLDSITPRIITLADNAGVRETKYTLTDMLYNDDSYEAGSYIIKTQEIGDGKGVVDSEISNDSIDSELRVIKLGKTTPTRVQTETDPYHWLGYSDDRAGMFVWNAVPLANAYKVAIYRGAEQNGQYEFISDDIVTDTYYDLPPDDERLTSEYYYYIEISACHIEDGSQTSDGKPTISPNYFTGDSVMTTSHERVTIPTDLVVKDDGIIYWNDGVQYIGEIGHYEVMYNANPSNAQVVKNSSGLSQDIPEMDLNLGTTAGTIAIQVRGIASTGNGYLNSNFSPQVVITKLADPNPRVKDGVFMWGTEGDGISQGSVTPTELTIDGGAKQVLNNQTTSLTYFTELNEYDSNYRANQDTAINKYPTGAHQFKVMFQGTSGSTVNNNGEFYLASNQLSFNATKLGTPKLENVVLEVNGDADNRVTWTAINGALDYKIIIFTDCQMSEQAKEKLNAVEIKSGDIVTGYSFTLLQNSDYFEEIKDGDNVIGYYFKLNDIIASFESSVDGITLNIHCQALGTVNSADAESGDIIYLNSSYSDVATITVPPMPTELRYVADEGKITWVVNSNSAFNIMLNVNYKMENVTVDEFNNYWKLSADAIGQNTGAVTTNPDKSITAYSEIKYRKIVYTIVSESIYHLEVTDTIMLLAKDGVTPTSYTLTSVGYNYSFGVTATIGNEDYDGVFKSVTNTLDENNTFDLFEKGDGSSYLPYQIDDQNGLNRIRYFKDRNFEIIGDITLENIKDENQVDLGYTWNIITGTFSGSINGNGYAIKNITTQIVNINGTTILSFMENNSGTIKDLRLEINYANSVLSATKLNVAGLAITNNGTINNVAISGYKEYESSPAGTINISAGNVANGTMVGGLVITNNAIIENSSVSINITSLDNGSYSTYAGGIACTNNGTISGSAYTGTITSNYLGGITASNYGTIDKCSVTGTINSTDRPASNSINTRKGSIAGGITAETFNGTTITNSYSTAKITITKDSSTGKTTYIGGIVGDLSSGAISTIKNCYVVVDFDYLTNITDNSVIANYVVESGINNGAYVGAENNYYLIAGTNEITATSGITGITLANDLENLKTYLSVLKDADDNDVYNISGAGYPTLN